MSLRLTEDFKTLDELHGETSDIVNQVHRTGRPVVITVDGKPEVVILSAADYEKKLGAANLRALLAEAEADIKAGRTRPVEEFLKELARGQKVPRGNHVKGRK
jgi:prevent-host-death family protein